MSDSGQELKEIILRGCISPGLKSEVVDFLVELERQVTTLRADVEELQDKVAKLEAKDD